MKIHNLFIIIIFILVSLVSGQNNPEIKVQNISENVYVLSGIGGNIAVLKSDDKLLVIDAGYVDTGKLLKEKIQKVFNLPIAILINTHYHQDHTGGNKAIASGVQIIAHKNCISTLKIMSINASKNKNGKIFLENLLLPNKDFGSVKEIKFGDETLNLFYFGPGHTKGDIVIVFNKSKIIHTGDLFFHNIAPYIDVRDGSDTGNWIKTINKLVKKYPDFTVIPGHGDVTNMKEFLKFSNYLQFLRDSVKSGLKKGKSIKEIQESTSFKNFPSMIEKNKFMTQKNNLKWVYQEISKSGKK